MSRICRYYQVYGRVQGVWFRGATRDRARELGLGGWVRNCEDGTVEAVACGDSRDLEAFRSWLHQGPPAASVDRVEEREAADSVDTTDFLIKP